MSSVTVEWTGAVPQALQTTQPAIIEQFLLETGFGRVSTATALGSTTTLVDTNVLVEPVASNQKFRGGYIRMVGGTALNLGLIRQLSDYNQTTGTLTFAPALPAAVAASDEYELWMCPIRPDVVLSILDRLTMDFGYFLPSSSFLSEIVDYDMEQAGTTAWSAVTSIIGKAGFSTLKKGVLGKQALIVTTTSPGGYATSAAEYGVIGGRAFWVSVQFTPLSTSASTTGFCTLWDVGNGVALDTIRTTSKSTTRLWKQISTNPTSTRVNIRMGQDENGVTGIWDEVVLLDCQSQSLPLPYWMTSPGSFKEARIWRPWGNGTGMQEYDPDIVGDKTDRWQPDFDGFTNGGQGRLKGPAFTDQIPFVRGVRSETAWSSLTEVKHYDLAWAAAGLSMKVYQRILGQFVGTALDREPLERQYNYWQDQWKQHSSRVMQRVRDMDGGPTEWYKAR